jgi:hypothetical protein
MTFQFCGHYSDSTKFVVFCVKKFSILACMKVILTVWNCVNALKNCRAVTLKQKIRKTF